MAQSTKKEFVVKFGDEDGNGSGLVWKINDPTRRWNKEFSEQSSHPKEAGGGSIKGYREDVNDDDDDDEVMEPIKQSNKAGRHVTFSFGVGQSGSVGFGGREGSGVYRKKGFL
ncbi:hypothetical protein F0562_030769 [Nyssa sinensis]|uniref:Uncharacterized protein n=1 Tax=Nyssa sinensis TaxID=561372 RepID=A0A5J5AZC3_9ASTE|nr:hypothetical protein F0562_030769 [Nyssa sinensis]